VSGLYGVGGFNGNSVACTISLSAAAVTCAISVHYHAVQVHKNAMCKFGKAFTLWPSMLHAVHPTAVKAWNMHRRGRTLSGKASNRSRLASVSRAFHLLP
jgi:hypothetical protein